MDYGDVIVHVFLDETRAYYDLDRLWADAPRRRVDRSPPRVPLASVLSRGTGRIGHAALGEARP